MSFIAIFRPSHPRRRLAAVEGTMGEAASTTEAKGTKQRSPEHPGIGLQEAVEKARVFYGHEGFNYTNVDVAKKHWGYAPKSSSGMRLLAALLHYGLFEETGGGDARRVRLTALAKVILLDRREDSTERDAAIKKAALNPTIIAALWKAWGAGWPISDASMEFELITVHKFNPDSVRAFIQDFKATIAFAKLKQSDPVKDAGDEEKAVGGVANGGDPPLPPPPPPPKIKQSQGVVMPEIQHAANNLPPLDLAIPLGNGQRAVLRIPAVLTQSEFDLILKLINLNLEAMRETIVVVKPSGAGVTMSAGDSADGS